jgi:hypothetical protein
LVRVTIDEEIEAAFRCGGEPMFWFGLGVLAVQDPDAIRRAMAKVRREIGAEFVRDFQGYPGRSR